ncbi:transmembrane 220 family protein [Pontibacter sp. SD6]|uniref:Transmembrane 220 family protein n=1 Tax=Pontibacter cellulosilyticus TaxID=1720253 RepID=A0A923SKY8_9BACT|nr:transmembrane 220 family protein [Pontibacter cellulosilyticus]
MKKILAIFFGLAFLSFVAVQYNDPDPTVWMVIYGAAAILCFLAAFNKVPHAILWIAVILCVAGGIYMWPEKYEGLSVGGGDIKNIEEAREALGLLMIAVIFGGFILADKYSQRSRSAAELAQKRKWA